MNARDLAPRTVGELLDASFFVYRRYFGRLALVAAVASAPTIVIAVLYSEAAANAVRDSTRAMLEATQPHGSDPTEMLRRMLSAYGTLLTPAMVGGLLQALSRAAVAAAMAPVALAAIRREPTPGLGQIARAALPRVLPGAVLQFVFDICWSSLTCCCPPIGAFLGVALAPASAILVLERGPAETWLRARARRFEAILLVPFAACFDAVVRGSALSWHAATFGRAAACLFVLLTIVWIFVAASTTPISVFAPESGHWFWVQHVAELLFLPALGLGRAFWYFDLLARREGADLEPTT